MKKWESALVSPDVSLGEAIKVLDREALRIALVVDRQRRLIGTVTDGDVRRALLNNNNLDIKVSSIMCRQPQVAHRDWSKARMLTWMEQHELLQLPIVDDDQKLIGLETLHGLLQRPRQDNPVFLMAGGFGKRLRPLTNTCPKPMLRVGDKPILELILEGFVNAGFHRFYISTHYMPEQIREHFGDGSQWNVHIQYVHEETPLGTGGALGLLPHDEIDQSLFMMNGDLLTNLNYLALLAFHEEHGGSATMCVREFEYQVPYGVIEADGYRAKAIVEKPVHTYNVNAGIYLLSPELVKRISSGTRIDMPTLLEQEMVEGHGVNLYPLKEYWLDIGQMDDFQRAQSDINEMFHDQ
ncbi:CBS domain-containing protein [Halomonas daqingensis]|uniref:nucleotidyltransferase family protein n=1 Tax=Billgrantia desiderata TaxID=52021 RepID=UPI001F3B4810|nr:nucleotidyltransferase family protein [Halomonas desiderata]MCE8027082.1 CBS domain-containing protein [Halomonas desiderata]